MILDRTPSASDAGTPARSIFAPLLVYPLAQSPLEIGLICMWDIDGHHPGARNCRARVGCRRGSGLTCVKVAPGDRHYLRTVGELRNIAKFERFFRRAGGLDIDKGDLRRYDDFVHQKAYDLLLRGEANANANGRDVIQPSDLPITKGLQESIHAYRRVNDEQLDVASILRQLTKLPQLDLAYSEETTAKLPEIMGGLSFALARCFRVLYPNLKNPQTQHWETVYQLFDLLL